MQNIKNTLQQGINNFIENNLGNPPELYEPINYSMQLGGKRLRPTLLLLACNAFGGDIKNALHAAIGIEVFHNFTLLHDDIMDNAPLRRNKPTVHQKWNNNIAILSGDTMFVKAYQQVLQTKHHHIIELLELFSKTAIEVCEGQQLDMNFETQTNININNYLQMIELKTAVLLAAALKMGSIIGNASAENANYMYEFGRNIGIAFQLQDDILDVYGNQENFGKMVGGDIACNKKTFLLLKSLELANPLQQDELKHWLESNDANSEPKINAIKNLYNQLNIRYHAENVMKDYFEKALNYLNKTTLTAEHKSHFIDFANQLMIRIN
jgi:geranylgeranyl diphosphate synthase type II